MNKLTKGIISRKEAEKLAPEYVRFAADRNWDDLSTVLSAFEKLRRGQECITYLDGQFMKVKVSTISHNDIRALDGPVVRVSNGEYSWRVDGNGYAFPISNG